MFQSQLIERQQQSGEDIGEQSTQKFQDDVFLDVIGGIDKKGRALGLGSHAAVLKESLKDSSYRDATMSEEISILNGQVQTLTAELQQKNIVQENITRKLDRYEQMFKRLMRDKNIKALLDAPEEEADAPEEEADYCNEEMGEAEMNDSLFH